MENFDLKGRDYPPARSDMPAVEGELLVREKLSELKDNSEILRKLDDIAKRAKDYTDANEGDLEED